MSSIQALPEYAVQQYLRSMGQGDFETAHASLSPDLQSECSVEDLFKQVSGGRRDQLDDNRITLESVQLVGETTSVTVKVNEFRGGGLFGSSEVVLRTQILSPADRRRVEVHRLSLAPVPL